MIARIFGFWTGDNPMNANRERGWASFGVTGLEPTLITPATLERWVEPGRPLHPAYEFLSPVHRSDYLRAYFMHIHGGGYADIKPQTGSWLEPVKRVNSNRFLWGAGYREVRGGSVWLEKAPILGRHHILGHCVPRVAASAATLVMRAARPLLMGNCAYAFKPGSPLTRAWLYEVERRLTVLLPTLRQSPADNVRARLGDANGYPIAWSAIHGDVLQPLALRHWARLNRSLPRPSFNDYS